MELNLTKILSSLTVLAAWAYSLGWIKSLYYFSTFGVGLESTELSVQDYLFASWYTVENVLFFILLLWVAVVAQRKWVYVVVLLYLPMPLLIDVSYSHLASPLLGGFPGWFVDRAHTVLKFVPFLVLLIVLVVHKDTHERFKDSSWAHGKFALAVLWLVVIAWSISAAKHFGTSEANRAMLAPDKYFLQITPPASANLPPFNQRKRGTCCTIARIGASLLICLHLAVVSR